MRKRQDEFIKEGLALPCTRLLSLKSLGTQEEEAVVVVAVVEVEEEEEKTRKSTA